MDRERSKERHQWERRWSQLRPEQFPFHISEPPEQLVRLVDEGGLPDGAALDVGCGAGIVTAYLSRFFAPAIGFDIARSAVEQASELAINTGMRAGFVVAAAPDFPIATDSCALVFDRGLLQHVPKQMRREYFREVERVLKPEGVFQLFCPVGEVGPQGRARASLLERVLRRVAGAMSSQALSQDAIRKLAPRGLSVVDMDQFDFPTSTRGDRSFVYALMRKRASS